MNDEQRKLVEDNTKLVHSVIGKHYPSLSGNEDIIQTGMVGLCKAAIAWNPTKCAFQVYACGCIRNEIRSYFRDVVPTVKVLSLDYEYGDGGTLSDNIEGDTDVATTFAFDAFMKGESDLTQTTIRLLSDGYNTKEISEITGVNHNRIKQIKRLTQKKWEGFLKYERLRKNSN